MCVRETEWEERESEGGETEAERMLTGSVRRSKELRVRPAGERLMESSE